MIYFLSTLFYAQEDSRQCSKYVGHSENVIDELQTDLLKFSLFLVGCHKIDCNFWSFYICQSKTRAMAKKELQTLVEEQKYLIAST
jgi:hypothetical protein